MKQVRGVTTSVGIAAVVLLFQLPAMARCLISEGATVVVRVPIGDLKVDTSARDSVDVIVNSAGFSYKEVCGKDRVEYTADNAPIHGNVDWNIIVPRNVNLDLVTLGGNITVGDSDGSANLRTTGGAVTVGRIKGKTTIVSQGGFIRAGDLGSDAELRITNAGAITVGNIAGNAELHTAGGPITVGYVNGKVVAKSAGGQVYLKGVHGDVVVTAEPGDIWIGDAALVEAHSTGGSITNTRVRGAFHGQTDSGNIRLERAGGSVDATTGYGTIFVRMVPENLAGDLHMNLQSGGGDVTIYIPERMRATIDATIDRPALSATRIFSDFPSNGLAPTPRTPGSGGTIQASAPANRFMSPIHQQIVLEGGGNPVQLHTSLGKIEIFKIRM
jgi:DUF4097 and DUF4098 domain-containing protein YvlB